MKTTECHSWYKAGGLGGLCAAHAHQMEGGEP